MREELVHFYAPQTKLPFYLEMAGISYCDGTYRIKRQDSNETVIEYVIDGRGYLNVNGENYAATAGDVYILRKKTTHTYWSDAKVPWVKIFFNIRGSLAETLLDEYQLGGTGKVVSPSEAKNKPIARKSIVAAKPIRQGEVFTAENLTTKRPGDGISPMRWYEVLGKAAPCDFEEDEPIRL